MEIHHTVAALRDSLAKVRSSNRKIALVPTMGNLHAGHLSLVDFARQHADVVVVSIFVNPTQFGPNEDFDAYPRTLGEDAKALKTKATEFLFAPGVEEIYPPAQAQRTSVHVQEITAKYCGENRPGHFTGVTTVVSKLFNIVQPDVAVFGQKDFQQLLTIEHMVADMRYPIEVLGAPTMREANGLAMSSRNGFLTAEQKAHAGLLQQTLQHCAAQLKAGNKDFAELEELALQTLRDEGFRPDYFQIASRFDLQPASIDDQRLVILAAAFLGKPRLIDNLQVDL